MSDYLGAPRFKVTEIEGYSMSMGSHNRLLTSFAVVDRAYCSQVVWGGFAGYRGVGPLWGRRMRAHEICDALNAKHAA